MHYVLTPSQKIVKRVFDLIVSSIGLIILCYVIIILAIISFFDTKASGIFTQLRVGKDGKLFKMYKIRTMVVASNTSSVTTSKDDRITRIGSFLRAYKLDELPQLYNVIMGDMSLVGPRPDVVGFADALKDEDSIILSVKPGITGPATLYFKNEEELLASQNNPELYNRTVIWPKKVEMNKKYINNYSFANDLKYIIKTFI